ncbi:GNAT family N-acetyltransferase [Clostridium sp. UBA7503]|uniref:GNAT family N-acetyltransferase n=1 Tax=Clostridium sp. UBA7503 TaxID=1946377 RepID=UPI003217BC11
MNIIKCQKQDLSSIFNIISKCKTHMESHNIYQWNEFYPSLDIIETNIISGNCYLLRDKGLSIGYFVIDEEQPSEYNNINWITQDEKVLVINFQKITHRLSVLPEYQGRGIAKKILKRSTV